MPERFKVPNINFAVQPVELVGSLPFGNGLVGADCIYDTFAQINVMAAGLSEHSGPLNVETNLIDCVEDCPNLIVGRQHGHAISKRRAEQLPGGTYLSLTNAAVAANARYLKDAKSFTVAFLVTAELARKIGLTDSGHIGCGA